MLICSASLFMLFVASRMLSPDGAPSVRAVHSQLKRMVYIEPEKGIFVHAVSIYQPRTEACVFTSCVGYLDYWVTATDIDFSTFPEGIN